MKKDTPKHRYFQWKSRLKTLHCEIDMTFDEWYGWWQATGKWDQRGYLPNSYCMSRIDNSLPYTTNNVECIMKRDKDKKSAKQKGLGIIAPGAVYDTLEDAATLEHHRRKTIKKYIANGVPGWSYK